jgi:NitT/TauT family transport system permease protein
MRWLHDDRATPVFDALVLVFALLLGWQLIARDDLFTPPVRTMVVLVDGFTAGWVLPHLAATMLATVASFAAGTVIGLLLGALLGLNRWSRTVLGPTLYWMYGVPKIIIYPLLLLMVGVNQQSLITLGTIAAFFPLAMNTAAGIRTVNRTHLKVARSFDASPWQLAWHVYLPTIRVPVLIGLRLAWSLAFLTVIMAEMVVANFGLGKLMFDSYANLNVARMSAVVLLVFCLAFVPNVLRVPQWTTRVEQAG